MERFCPICERRCPGSRPECESGEKYAELDRLQHGSLEGKLTALFYKLCHLFTYRNGQNQGKNRILAILLHYGDMTQRQLRDYTYIRSASLSELLAKIEAHGDITRECSKQNARNVNVCLTAQGSSEAQRINKENQQFAREIFSPLSKEEQESLEKILLKLLFAWKSGAREED